MKRKRRIYLAACAALRLGAKVVLSFDREVVIACIFIGKVGRGQALKLARRGASIERNIMWRDVEGGHFAEKRHA